MAPAPAMGALEGTERLGRKNGRGFYRYDEKGKAEPDPSLYDDLKGHIVRRSSVSEAEIRDRTVLIMVNEAARVLEDGIVASAGDVDLGMITGTGFPPFRGGLLRYADALGLPTVLAKLEALEAEHGARFTPAPLLRRKAAAGERFYA
jgi:3-hydroxyacyl-CoA dehydrogenase